MHTAAAETGDFTGGIKPTDGLLLHKGFGKSRIKQITDAMAFPQVQQVRQHLQRRTHALVVLDTRVGAIPWNRRTKSLTYQRRYVE